MRTYEDMRTELNALCRVFEKYLQVSKMPKDFGTDEQLFPSEIHLISAIAGQGTISVTELARLQGNTKGAISQVLGKLEKKGLISRKPDPAKRSRVLVTVTDKGWDAHQNHCAFHAQHDADFINYLATLDGGAFEIFGELCTEMERWMDTYLQQEPQSASPCKTTKEQPDAE